MQVGRERKLTRRGDQDQAGKKDVDLHCSRREQVTADANAMQCSCPKPGLQKCAEGGKAEEGGRCGQLVTCIQDSLTLDLASNKQSTRQPWDG